MLNKKEVLIKLMEENKIVGFTLLGVPSKELVENYFSEINMLDFFKSKGITDVTIYFPYVKEVYTDICAIFVSRIVSKKELNKIIKLFDCVLEYYQANIPPVTINKICGLYENEPFTFNDIVILTSDTQTEIAKKINKSKQTLTDMKSGKCKCNIEVLASLMQEYPLLPWNSFISSYIPK